MEKQYSVDFFSSLLDSIQKLCREHLRYEHGVELSGYLALEIDSFKKERYVLSELVQGNGQVISESYCTKAFKTVKKLPEVVSGVENVSPSISMKPNSNWTNRLSSESETHGRKRQTSHHRGRSEFNSHNFNNDVDNLGRDNYGVSSDRVNSFNEDPANGSNHFTKNAKRSNADHLFTSPSNKKGRRSPYGEVPNPSHTNDTLSNSAAIVIKDENEDDQFTANAAEEERISFPYDSNVVTTPSSYSMSTSDDPLRGSLPDTDDPYKNSKSTLSAPPAHIYLPSKADGTERTETTNENRNRSLKSTFEIWHSRGDADILGLNFPDNDVSGALRSYRCDICGYEASRNYNLQRHMRIHTGERVSCHLCDKKYIDNYKLKFHMRSHYGLEQISQPYPNTDVFQVDT